MERSNRREWLIAAGVIALPRLRLMAEEVLTNIVAMPVIASMTHKQEIYQGLFSGWRTSMDEVRTMNMLSGIPPWKAVIRENFVPETVMPGGYRVSSVKRTYSREKTNIFELAPTCTLVTIYSGSNPPPGATNVQGAPPVLLGVHVGGAQLYSTDNGTRDTTTYSPVTFWAKGAEAYPQGLNFRALLTNEYTGAFTNIGGAVYPSQTNLFTISPPGSGLWWIRSVTFSH
jgi:hypothetical protein